MTHSINYVPAEGAVCIYGHTDGEEETALSLVEIALERTKAFEKQLRELNDHSLDLGKETGKFEATPIETDQPA